MIQNFPQSKIKHDLCGFLTKIETFQHNAGHNSFTLLKFLTSKQNKVKTEQFTVLNFKRVNKLGRNKIFERTLQDFGVFKVFDVVTVLVQSLGCCLFIVD